MEIAWLEIADPPDLWRDIGYQVDDAGRCFIGGVQHRLLGNDAGHGVVGWAVTGIDESVSEIDGIPTKVIDRDEVDDPQAVDHPNAVFRVDHLVVRTSSTPRTCEAFETLGLSRRGGRTTNSAGDAVDMTFFWVGETLLELAGPPTPSANQSPATFSGIAYATRDLDATVGLLGERSSDPVDAVQPGRRIAALTQAAGSSVPMAFMTPHVRVN